MTFCATELLSSLDTILTSVSLPRITHILDATPNLLIALYEALHQQRIPLVDRTSKSHTCFNSRVRNIKLLIGTIAHEANISSESAVRLGEVDPLKVCQKEVRAVRNLLWVLVEIGILQTVQWKNELSPNAIPSKAGDFSTPRTGGHFTRDRFITNQSSMLQKRRESVGIQTVSPGPRHRSMKVYNWVQNLPTSFSTISRTSDGYTENQRINQDPYAREEYRSSSIVTKTSNCTRAKPVQLQKLVQSDPNDFPRTHSEPHGVEVLPHTSTTRRSSQIFKPASYPHAVYDISHEQIPLQSADISPVSTVYLEHVSAKIMKISNRLPPITRPLGMFYTEDLSEVSEQLASNQAASGCSRDLGSSTRSTKDRSNMLQGCAEEVITDRDHNINMPVFIAPTNTASVPREMPNLATTVSLQKRGLDEVKTLQLPLEPHATTSNSESTEGIDMTGASVPFSQDPTSGTIGESLAEDDKEIPDHKGLPPHDCGVYERNESEDGYTTSSANGDCSAEGFNRTLSITQEGDCTDDHTEDMQLCGNSQLEDSKPCIDLPEHQNQEATPVECMKPTLTAADVELEFTHDHQYGKFVQCEAMCQQAYGASFQAGAIYAEPTAGMHTKKQLPEPLLVDSAQLTLPSSPGPPVVEENLIDLLSDPIPVGLLSLPAMYPMKKWVVASRDLRSESYSEVKFSPEPLNKSQNLSECYIESVLGGPMLSNADPACVPLPDSDTSSVGLSTFSTTSVHQGTQTDTPIPEGVPALIKEKVVVLSSPHLVTIPNSPTGSDSTWMGYSFAVSQTSKHKGRKLSQGILTSTPKKAKPMQGSSRMSSTGSNGDTAGHPYTRGPPSTESVNDFCDRLSILDTEELSDSRPEHHGSNYNISPPSSPPSVHLSICNRRLSSPLITPPNELLQDRLSIDRHCRLSPAINDRESLWETEEEEEGAGEGKKDSDVYHNLTCSTCSPSDRQFQDKRMQEILQNWDQAGASQPSEEESEYFPDHDSGVKNMEQNEDAEYDTTRGSGSEFSPKRTSPFEEPQTPTPQSKPRQKRNNTTLDLSTPPHLPRPKLPQSPDTPYTPLRPRRLFSTAVQFTPPVESQTSPIQDPGSRTLPITPTVMTLTPPPVLSWSLTIGNGAGRRKRNFGSFLKRSVSPVAGSTSIETVTRKVTPLKSIELSRTQMSTQMSKSKSRIAPTAQSTPSTYFTPPSTFQGLGMNSPIELIDLSYGLM